MAIEKKEEYLALARKYRPQTFEDVVGQNHVLEAIANAIDSNRLHHAYLLTGTRGIGKTTIARIIAKSLECEQGMSSHPCGVCNACKSIIQGTFSDVIEIDGASQTKVEDTRQLLENTQYPPMQGRYKIYIIDEVHMLTTSSFNALLKTLEEPPEYVKFILATTDPHKIPTTVLSRTLQFQLKSLSKEDIKGQIIKIAQKENLPFEDDAISLIARAGRGSMRDALSLTDQAIALGNGSIVKDKVQGMLGTVGDKILMDILDLLSQEDLSSFSTLLDNIVKQSPNYKNLLQELSILLHDLALYQVIGKKTQLVFTFEDSALEHYASLFHPNAIQLFYQITLEGMKEFDISQDGRLAFEMTLLRLLAFNPEKKKIG